MYRLRSAATLTYCIGVSFAEANHEVDSGFFRRLGQSFDGKWPPERDPTACTFTARASTSSAPKSWGVARSMLSMLFSTQSACWQMLVADCSPVSFSLWKDSRSQYR